MLTAGEKRGWEVRAEGTKTRSRREEREWGGSGVGGVVKVGVSIVGDLREAEADFEILPNFGKLCSGETGVGTRCVIGRLHKI